MRSVIRPSSRVRGDLLHALQRLEPRLGLAGLGRLGPEPVDEGLHVGDLLLLFFVPGLLQGHALGALPFELRIAPGVAVEPALLDMHDVVDGVVEEIAVVRDQHQRPGIAFQPAFQPLDGLQVEVVGRLVEQ